MEDVLVFRLGDKSIQMARALGDDLVDVEYSNSKVPLYFVYYPLEDEWETITQEEFRTRFDTKEMVHCQMNYHVST